MANKRELARCATGSYVTTCSMPEPGQEGVLFFFFFNQAGKQGKIAVYKTDKFFPDKNFEV